MPWWLWFVFAIALFVVEILTPGTFVFVFFGIGALLAMLIASARVTPAWLEWAIFALTGPLLFVALRHKLKQWVKPHAHARSLNSSVGEHGIAKQTIAVGESGTVELRGSVWQGRNVGEKPIAAGDRCKVRHERGIELDVECE